MQLKMTWIATCFCLATVVGLFSADALKRPNIQLIVADDVGYATSITGKWHQPGNPLDSGFDSFYGFLGGQIDSWTGAEGGKPSIQSNRQDPKPVPQGWYGSDAFTDDAIAQIDSASKEGKRFFAYLAFNAPHSPLHAPRENVEKYYDRYLAGWESLR